MDSKPLLALLLGVALLGFAACDRPGNSNGSKQKDPHVVRNPGDFKEDPKFISPPTLGQPIYACSSAITAQNFLPGAKIEVFIDGAPAPNPSFIGMIPSPGQTHDTGVKFKAGQVVYVTQTLGSAVSAQSNHVTVTSHTEDFPAGLPKPRLFARPLYQCGHAVLVEDVVPGSTVTVHAEDDAGGGAFKPIQNVGGFQASTEWGLNWTGVNPEFTLAARISATAKLCTDNSPRSDYEITAPGPSPVPPGSLEKPIINGQTLVTAWGKNGPPNDPAQHGAILTVCDTVPNVRGQTSTPGGVPHIFGISPAATTGEKLDVTQKLCTESLPGDPTVVEDCNAMPAPIIKAPLPGDTKIVVTQQIPGAEILVFASGQEIGHSSGSVINLSRPVKNGETVTVMQRLGKCTGRYVYQIKVECALGTAPGACSSDWPAFRQNGLRTARQTQASPLGDPYAVKKLEIKASTVAPDGGEFIASPVIVDGRVFIGSSGGHLYAFDANFVNNAAELWQFPPKGQNPLSSDFVCNPSSGGIAASVAAATSRERGALIILGAPDKGRPDDPGGKFGSGLGSGRIFALNPATGALVWKTTGEVARLTGMGQNDLHEQIGYSAPLVLGNRIYVGIADHCDNPIQKGKVRAINLDSGAIDAGFNYESVSDANLNNNRGGGVWTYVSGGLGDGLVTTTGNVKNGTSSEPSTNNALAMVRIDPATGAVQGKIQPVPYINDSDPDWSAGATLMAASCGDISASTMKDGWTYAGNFSPSLSFRWQYPNTSYPFPTVDPINHGDIRYHRAGAAWNDTYYTMSGGQQLLDTSDPVHTFQGYRKLHAFNVCAGEGGRVRWIAHLDAFTDPVSDTHSWALGPPTVTDGIVYVGTNQGFLLAIADPAVWPSQGGHCTLPTLSTADCVAAGYKIVSNPTVLKALSLGGQILRGEPALANGTVYVASSNRKLFRIAPGK